MAGPKTQRIIATCKEDVEYLDKLEHQIEMLTGMVIEMVKEHPSYLLSPVMRELLADKAVLVKGMMDQVHNHLCADNLGDPFRYPKGGG